jgi:hypothetical protein
MTAIRPYRAYSAPQLCAHYHRLSRGDHRQPTAGQGDRRDIYRQWMLLLWAVFRPFSAYDLNAAFAERVIGGPDAFVITAERAATS